MIGYQHLYSSCISFLWCQCEAHDGQCLDVADSGPTIPFLGKGGLLERNFAFQTASKVFWWSFIRVYHRGLSILMKINDVFLKLCHMSTLHWLRPPLNSSWKLHNCTSKGDIESPLRYNRVQVQRNNSTIKQSYYWSRV